MIACGLPEAGNCQKSKKYHLGNESAYRFSASKEQWQHEHTIMLDTLLYKLMTQSFEQIYSSSLQREEFICQQRKLIWPDSKCLKTKIFSVGIWSCTGVFRDVNIIILMVFLLQEKFECNLWEQMSGGKNEIMSN